MLEKYQGELPSKVFISKMGHQKIMDQAWNEEIVFKAYTSSSPERTQYVTDKYVEKLTATIAQIASGNFNSIEEIKELAKNALS